MSKMRKPDMSAVVAKTKITAMHEAAHAVTALTFGINVEAQVVNDPKTHSAGVTTFKGQLDPEQDAIVTFAGYVVEVEHMNVVEKTAMRGAASDMEFIDQTARTVSSSIGGRTRFKSQTMTATKVLVAANLTKIEKIANMLMTGEKVAITVEMFKKM